MFLLYFKSSPFKYDKNYLSYEKLLQTLIWAKSWVKALKELWKHTQQQQDEVFLHIGDELFV